MLVLKAIRPDKIIQAIQNYITEQLGKQYIEPPVFRLSACFDDSSKVTPLIFVLSPGSDPVA
jgi:dynein heavy chain